MTIRCAIAAIGNEILEGSIIDTNSSWLASLLTRHGITITSITAQPDEHSTLTSFLREICRHHDLVLTTGGLGPTFDDLTSECVSIATDREWQFTPEAFEHIRGTLEAKGVAVKETHHRQARLPAGSILFPNRMGTAYGFGVEHGESVIISMPGVPYEMKPMFLEHILPFIRTRFQLQQRFMTEVRFAEIPESDVDAVIRELGIPERLDAIINVSKGEILVRMRSYEQDLVSAYAEKLRQALPRAFIGFSGDTLGVVLLRILGERGETLSTAESCTGGLIGAELTAIPGSSAVYRGGTIVYSNSAKQTLLDVPHDVLEQFGAVSAETAEIMVRNVMSSLNTDAGLSVTGFAGPDGGTPQKPVGTVFIGIAYHDTVKVRRLDLPGDRESIRLRAMKLGLKSLINLITG